MFQAICILTGIVIIGSAMLIYVRTQDALHPGVVVAPLFFYMYSFWPIGLNFRGGLEFYIPPDKLAYAATLFLASIVCMYIGLLTKTKVSVSRERPDAAAWTPQRLGEIAPKVRRLSMALGFVAVAAHWHMLNNVGGFIAAYSRNKGGGFAESGYIGEATLLAYPAILLLAMSIGGIRRIRLTDVMLALIYASPHLMQGTFGGRRGPLFLVLATLFFSWYLARGIRPNLRKAIVAVSLIGFAVIVVGAQRQYVHLGSSEQFESARIWDDIAPEQVEQGNTYLAAVASVLASDYFADYYWGYRYFVTFLVRPIPHQLWPTKYEDMGADWMASIHDIEQLQSYYLRYREAVGFYLPNGVSVGSIADGYQEFSWGVLLMFFIIGHTYSYVWRLHRTQSGFWSIIFYIMLALSIYLPSQSFSAWAVRLLFMVVLALVSWRYWLRLSISLRGSARRPPKAIRPPHLARLVK